MKIEDKLTAAILQGIKQLYGQEVPEKMVQLQKTKKEFEGHLTLVVFPFLKMSKKGPEQTAQEIGEYLKQNEPAIAEFNVIKGFLNLTIASDVWVELLNTIHKDDKWGIKDATDESPLVTKKTLCILYTCLTTCWLTHWILFWLQTLIRC